MAKFSVVSLMREDAVVLRRFVDYYLNHGASHITIYFDGKCPVVISSLPPLVEVIEVGEELRSEIPSGDPRDLIGLQNLLFVREHRRAIAEWLLVVDADEFVYSPQSLAEVFSKIGKNVDSIRFPVGEAVWTPADDLNVAFGCSYFRLPLGRYTGPLTSVILYGRNTHLYRRGLLGHAAGKHAVRTSIDVDVVGCHHSEREGTPLGQWSADLGWSDAFVAHFDAINFDRWKEKWSRRYSEDIKVFGMGRGRNRQLVNAGRAIERGNAEAYFRQLYSVSQFQMSILSMLGRGRHASIFPTGSS